MDTKRRFLGVVVLLLASCGGCEAVMAQAAPKAPVATAVDCQSLLHQFDVAVPAKRNSTRVAEARRSRDLGDVACRYGHYGEGVRHLRRALHDIGVKPVKAISPRVPLS